MNRGESPLPPGPISKSVREPPAALRGINACVWDFVTREERQRAMRTGHEVEFRPAADYAVDIQTDEVRWEGEISVRPAIIPPRVS